MSKWPKKKLCEIAAVYGGSTPSRDDPSLWGGDVAWLSPAELPMPGEGIARIRGTRETITQAGLNSCAATLLPRGTVVFSSRATIGKIGVTETPLATNQGFVSFVPSAQLSADYLAYALLVHTGAIASLAGSTTFKEVTRGSLRSFEIPVPPLAEQERIVRLLDEAAALRRLRTQADKRTAAAIPALFDEMFGDPTTNPRGWPLVCAGDLMVSCDYGTSTKASDDGRGVPMLRMGNVTEDGLLALEDLKTVELTPAETSKYRLARGDVLFNRTNSRELVGKTGTWDGRFEAVAASYFIRVRFDGEREHPQHFTSFMNLPFMKHRLRGMAKGAIGQANINAQELKGIDVPLPPITLQRTFATRVAEIRALEAEQLNSRKRLDDLFQSLLQRAFSGDL